MDPDIISFVFYDNSFFKGDSLWPPWPMRLKERAMKAQMDASTGAALDAASDVAQAGAAATFGLSAILQLLFMGSLNNILSVIQNLQIVVHRMLANTKTPANAQIFFAKICTIVAYDIFGVLLDLGNNVPKYMDLPSTGPITVTFEALGYGTAFYAINLGSVFIFYILEPFYIIWLFTSRWLYRKCRLHKRAEKAQTNINEYFWNGFISSIEEMYIIVAICILVNIKYYMEHGILWDLNFLCMVINSIGMIGYTGLCIYLCFVPVETLENEEVKDRIGVIYDDLNIEGLGRRALIEPNSSNIRRIVLCVVLVWLVDHPVLQLHYFCFVSLLTIGIIG